MLQFRDFLRELTLHRLPDHFLLSICFLDFADGNRIAAGRNDDGHGGRSFLQRTVRGRARGHNQVDLRIQQFRDEPWQALRVPVGIALFEHEILSRRIAKLTHAAQQFGGAGLCRLARSEIKVTDSPDSGRLLADCRNGCRKGAGAECGE